jgi:general secretion pathway protein E
MVETVNEQLREIAFKLGLPFKEHLGETNPPRDLVRGDFDRIGGSWGRYYNTVPIDSTDREIVVATADPLNIEAFDQLYICYNKPIRTVVTTPDEINRVINEIRTSLMSDRASTLNAQEEGDESDEGEFLNTDLKIDVTDSEDEESKIIRYVNSIIFKAHSDRASDVHIEPYETKVKVRFRIDGVLYDEDSADKKYQAAIASRIKVMSGLDIAEKRLPQDGRFGRKIAGKEVDIRVSTIPTQYGERVVMRLLNKSGMVINLEQLGIQGENLKTVEKLINKPNGIVLVTGPTGSGKTTTLYSCLASINTPGLNILTVEDPIEYELSGIGQMQVNPKINFTFASGLRAILRQDPDVVMVGEIRDAETAGIAIQASQTGHLVLSTLHTNDASGAITRLLDMGIEPFLVSSSLLAVMAQRLVRRLCPVCKESYEISDEEIRELGISEMNLKGSTIYRPGAKECSHCRNNRYLGRTGIHELLIIDDELRSLIIGKSDANSIKQAAMKRGMKTLRADGASKVLLGETSIEEVLLATQEEA